MPSSYHNVQVRSDAKQAVIDLLENDPALSLFEYFVSDPNNGWVAVLPQRIDKGVKTAKSLSHKLHTDAFSFRTYSQDAFLYAYFRNGEKHDEFCSSPGVMKQLQEMDDEMASIVLQWEQGDLSAEEYRDRVAEYLSNFDARKARVLGEIDRVVGSAWSEKTFRLISDIVTAEFRGKEADDIVREVVSKRFPNVRVEDAMPKAASTGGKPNTYAHLLKDAPSVERLLKSSIPAMEMLDRLGSLLGVTRAASSFQHEVEHPTGLSRVSGPLA